MKPNRLSERAMLVHFASHGWTGRKLDKTLTSETANDQGAEQDALEVMVCLIPRKELQEVNSTRALAYTVFTSATLPWMDGAVRILPCQDFMSFQEQMRKAMNKHREAVDRFVQRLPSIVSNTKRLGKLARRHRMPTVAELKSRFDISVDIYPVPDIADFRAKVGTEEATEIEAEIKANIESRTTFAMREVWNRLSGFVTKIAETMRVKDKRFHDSLFKNLKEFCQELPKFNLTNDPAIDQIRAEVLNKLGKLNTDELREIPNSRKKVAADAEAVLAKISQYLPK